MCIRDRDSSEEWLIFRLQIFTKGGQQQSSDPGDFAGKGRFQPSPRFSRIGSPPPAQKGCSLLGVAFIPESLLIGIDSGQRGEFPVSILGGQPGAALTQRFPQRFPQCDRFAAQFQRRRQ